MKRLTFILLATLFILSGSLIAQKVKTLETEVHYYLFEFTNREDSGAVIIEIATDQPQSPGREFTEVTLEELQQKGYYTTGPAPVFTDYSYGHSSGITRTKVGGSWDRRRITCESVTNRTNTLGNMYLHAQTWRNGEVMYEWEQKGVRHEWPEMGYGTSYAWALY